MNKRYNELIEQRQKINDVLLLNQKKETELVDSINQAQYGCEQLKKTVNRRKAIKYISMIFLIVAVVGIFFLDKEVFPKAEIDTYVCYTTDYGECYHARGCGYLKSSAHITTVYHAQANGYRSCSRCSPTERTVAMERKPLFIVLDGGLFLICIILFWKVPNASLFSAEEKLWSLKDKLNKMESDISQCEQAIKKYTHESEKTQKSIANYLDKRPRYEAEIQEKSFLKFAGVPENLLFNSSGYVIGTKQHPECYYVYVYTSGKKYHSICNCQDSITSNKIPVGQALERGYLACKRCTNREEPRWILQVQDNLSKSITLLEQYDVSIPDKDNWMLPRT